MGSTRRQWLFRDFPVAAAGTGLWAMGANLVLPPSVSAEGNTFEGSHLETAHNAERSYAQTFKVSPTTGAGRSTNDTLDFLVQTGISRTHIYINIAPIDPTEKTIMQLVSKVDIFVPSGTELKEAEVSEKRKAVGKLGKPVWEDLLSQPYLKSVTELMWQITRAQIPYAGTAQTSAESGRASQEKPSIDNLEDAIEKVLGKNYIALTNNEINGLEDMASFSLGNKVAESFKIRRYPTASENYLAIAKITTNTDKFTPSLDSLGSRRSHLEVLVPIGSAETLQKYSKELGKLGIKVGGLPTGMILEEVDDRAQVPHLCDFDPSTNRILSVEATMPAGYLRVTSADFKNKELVRVKYTPRIGVTDRGAIEMPTRFKDKNNVLMYQGSQIHEINLSTGEIKEIESTDIHFPDILPGQVEKRADGTYFRGCKISGENGTSFANTSPDGKKILFIKDIKKREELEYYDSTTCMRRSAGWVRGTFFSYRPQWSTDSKMFTFHTAKFWQGRETYILGVSDTHGNQQPIFEIHTSERNKLRDSQWMPRSPPIIISDTHAIGIVDNEKGANPEKWALGKFRLTYG
ncbi:MAG: hypothetical protein ABIE22_04520 [archaeon]